MEIVFDLNEFSLSINGDKQDCNCQAEVYYGDRVPDLGKHYGCINLVRVLLTACKLQEELEKDITKIIILPERSLQKNKDTEYVQDNTKIQFWNTEMITETYWRNIYKLQPLFLQIKRESTGSIRDLWKGKSCRGFDLKYIQEPKKVTTTISKEEKQRILDAIANIDPIEVDKILKEKLNSGNITVTTQTPEMEVLKPSPVTVLPLESTVLPSDSTKSEVKSVTFKAVMLGETESKHKTVIEDKHKTVTEEIPKETSGKEGE